jgi:hypothetical protein
VFTIETIAGSNGVIIPTGTSQVAPGGDLTVKIIPFDGYKVTDVLVDGVSVGDVLEYTFTSVSSDHTIEASFELSITKLISQYSVSSAIDINDPSTFKDNTGILSKAHFIAEGNPSKVKFQVGNGYHSGSFEWASGKINIYWSTWNTALNKSEEFSRSFTAAADRYWATVEVIGDRIFIRAKGSDLNELVEAQLNSDFNLQNSWQVRLTSIGSNPSPSGMRLEDFFIKGDFDFVSGFAVEHITLNDEDIANKFIVLPTPVQIDTPIVNMTEGTTQLQGLDFEMLPGNILSWDGLLMEEALEVGDGLRIIYQTQAPETNTVQTLGRRIIGLR